MPREYYLLLPHELNATIEGYQRRQYKLSCEKRHAAFLSILPFTKDVTIEKFCRDFWPLAGDQKPQDDEPKEMPVIEADLWNKILERHNIKQK